MLSARIQQQRPARCAYAIQEQACAARTVMVFVYERQRRVEGGVDDDGV